ncbi:MAG TPA: universal stress protein [Polyangiaceae bacterium]|nr:universal stress protein [Polyangiaceae bacterium]
MQRSSFRDAARGGPARLSSLLVPIDLTPNSDRVLGRLLLLPLANDARVTILHVIPDSLRASELRDAERDASKALASEVRHLQKSLPKSVCIQPLVKVGVAVKEISAWAQKVKAELIVMGRGGGRVLREAFLGSTAERVVRQARLPVLVVRLAPRHVYGRPALALDFDRAAHEVVRLLLLVLPPPRPRVSVIHAYDFPYGGLVYPSLAEEEADGEKSELQLEATEKLARLLAASLAKANVRPEDAPRWKTHVRYGSPHVVVEKVMRRSETDLLLLGTRGFSRAAHIFLGTIAGDLLREAKCDVLLVPPAVARRSQGSSTKKRRAG